MSKQFRSWTIWILAVAVVAAMRHVTVLSDFYALHIYPAVSWTLSLVVSIVPFSLEEITVVAFAAIAVVMLCRKKFLNILKLAAVIYIWFYIGWGINYSRTRLLDRVGVERAQYDEETFRAFLYDFSSTLDSLYICAQESDDYDVETGMKDFYSKVSSDYGLARPRKWQHVKKPLFNGLYSGSGVLGFMGPFFAESQLNNDLLPDQYPFTLMHEYSHLLGTAVESEANWWAFQACNAQPNARVRYSAYFSLLPYVWSNAKGLLESDAFDEWFATINPEIIEQYQQEREFWLNKRFAPLDKAQTFIYNLFLKGNGIPSGMQNYSEVVGLLMALPEV